MCAWCFQVRTKGVFVEPAQAAKASAALCARLHVRLRRVGVRTMARFAAAAARRQEMISE